MAWPRWHLRQGFPRALGASPHPKCPPLQGCWRRAGSIRGALALPPFPQIGKTEAESGHAIQAQSASLIDPAPPGLCLSRARAQWLHFLELSPGTHEDPPGTAFRRAAYEGYAASLASLNSLAPLVRPGSVASTSGPVPGMWPLPKSSPPAGVNRCVAPAWPGLVVDP